MSHLTLWQLPCMLRVHAAVQIGAGATRIIVAQMVPDSDRTCFLAVDSHTKVVHANLSVHKLLGYTPNEMINMKLPQLMPQPYAQLHER